MKALSGLPLTKLAIAVGTLVAECPPHRPGRALIGASRFLSEKIVSF
jgi:hypothetical protein